MDRSSFLIITLLLFITSPAWAVDVRFSSFIESAPSGKIDWDNGYFYGTGIGYPHENEGSKARALKVAQAGALSAILQVAAGLRVDDQRILQDLEKEKAIIQIKGLVHYEPYSRKFVKKGSHPFFKVTYRAPMTGVEGLTRRLLTQLKSRATFWKDFPRPGPLKDEDNSLPWLVLDARGLAQKTPVRPAIFPKIVSETGETIYELSNVDEAALTERGMVRYVVSDASPGDLRSRSGKSTFTKFMELLSPRAAQAGEKRKRKKRGKYIIKDVQQVRGLMKTNIVISES
ncbi:MAG: hypothetical protein JRD02_11925, partial [Deltaproteobacteria bacterium]|nr:hypothetical protein [Deltaproteobacteria bacterium]